MRQAPLLAAVWVLFLTLQAAAKPLTFYVATNGNDAWSGRLAAPARNGQDGPLATLPAALKVARTARREASKASQGIAILLRGGTYELREPVVLTPEDSGASAEHPLVIGTYRREKPVLSGGRRISGWRSVAGKPGLWEAEVPAVRGGQWYFRSLFVNGQRRQRARTPNQGFFHIRGASPQDKPVKLRFSPGEIRKEWADDGDVEVIALLAWAELRMQIRSVDDAANVATLSGNPRPSNKEDSAQYYVENAPDGLDAPGEWYLNRRTGIVQYLAVPGEDPNKAEVIVPLLDDLVLMQGDFAARKPVQHVILRGLAFSYTDWMLGPQGYADTQAAFAIHGDLRAEGAVDCVIEDCVLSHLAGYGIELGRGCQRVRVVGNDIADIGAGGIRIGEPAVRKESFEMNHQQEITDNQLRELGRIYPAAVGIIIFQSGQNHVAHNDIHDLYYTAVSVGWNWGYQETPCRENVIEFNHLHDIGQGVLSDMGAIYTLGIQKGTVIRNNLIHDVNAHTYGGWGLYTDEGSTGIVLENNLVYRCKSAGFHQHYGRENVVRNNLFAFNKEHQLMRTREENHLSFTLERNIVYFDSGDLLGSNWSNDRFNIDSNVYFDTRLRSSPAAILFKGTTIDAWRQRGHDRNSVLADPRFLAPEKLDFRLKRDSPALTLGFQPIDLRRVGVRRH